MLSFEITRDVTSGGYQKYYKWGYTAEDVLRGFHDLIVLLGNKIILWL